MPGAPCKRQAQATIPTVQPAQGQGGLSMCAAPVPCLSHARWLEPTCLPFRTHDSIYNSAMRGGLSHPAHPLGHPPTHPPTSIMRRREIMERLEEQEGEDRKHHSGFFTSVVVEAGGRRELQGRAGASRGAAGCCLTLCCLGHVNIGMGMPRGEGWGVFLGCLDRGMGGQSRHVCSQCGLDAHHGSKGDAGLRGLLQTCHRKCAPGRDAPPLSCGLPAAAGVPMILLATEVIRSASNVRNVKMHIQVCGWVRVWEGGRTGAAVGAWGPAGVTPPAGGLIRNQDGYRACTPANCVLCACRGNPQQAA